MREQCPTWDKIHATLFAAAESMTAGEAAFLERCDVLRVSGMGLCVVPCHILASAGGDTLLAGWRS